IGELEWARHKARHAPHAAPAAIEPLPRWSNERARALRVVLHPSVSLVASRFPIATIWEANRSGSEAPFISQWNAEAVLVARPFLRVEMRRLPPGGHALLAALSAGAPIG